MKTILIISACLTFCFSYAQEGFLLPRNIVITEILPIPVPDSGVFQREFIEIYNSSDDTLKLSDFTLSDSTKLVPFPTYNFAPHTYLILCRNSDTLTFKPFGNVLGFKTFITLNNGADKISIHTKEKNLIDAVEYSGEVIKGVTIELFSLKETCHLKSIWKPCLNKSKGTPGMPNSYFHQENQPSLLYIKDIEVTNDTLIIALSESIHSKNNSSEVFIDENKVPNSHIIFSHDFSHLFIDLHFFDNTNGNCEVRLTKLLTCTGYEVPELKGIFFKGAQADSLDIVINEVLFNPIDGAPDFVEIYNQSEKNIDISSFILKSIKKNNSEEQTELSEGIKIIAPKEIIAFTSSIDLLCEKYPCPDRSKIIETAIPSYNIDEGVVMICDPSGRTIDRFDYFESYHLPLLENYKGVSLERISPSLSTNDKDSWNSAASVSGFGTPGSVNSHDRSYNNIKNWVVDPVAFSPDNDGYNDFTTIYYNSEIPASITSVTVFDVHGRTIKKILNNESIGNKGIIKWDGTDENLTVTAPGHYILKIESFNLNGEKEELKISTAIIFPK